MLWVFATVLCCPDKGPQVEPVLCEEPMTVLTDVCFLAQLFNPYGHNNLFTYLSTSEPEWKACRKAFAKSMSLESIRCA